LCETLGVSRSADYDWCKNEFSLRQLEDSHLKPIIQSISWEHRRRYGARRIAIELADRKQLCSRRRVGQLMKEMESLSLPKAEWRIPPESLDLPMLKARQSAHKRALGVGAAIEVATRFS
jgi:hypothetical protein